MTALKEKKIDIQMANSDKLNFKKLLKGRIDIFPNEQLVGRSQISNIFSDEKAKLFTYNPKEFAISTLNLIINKKSKRANFFLNKFNSGLNKLKKSGKIEQMYKELKLGKYNKQKNRWKK